jgi:23S rRNA (cytidine1920-2'-O)/16S rRNA (cytidine1409-2'-O)-methyltransferase
MATSREQAQQLIEQGIVLVGGVLADKPARLVSLSDPLEIDGDRPAFVSRGGNKLDAALEHFGLEVAGRLCLDAGASTGGFTDCLLQRGAAQVVALDVGRGQLASSLAQDSRVQAVDRTNLRHVTVETLGGLPFSLVVADLSFISLTTVAPVLAGDLAAQNADLVVLVKPQFEVGRVEASRGRGVIRDPELHRTALEAVTTAFVAVGTAVLGVMPSPIRGRAGNVEFLLHGRAHAHEGERRGPLPAETAAMLDAVVSLPVEG